LALVGPKHQLAYEYSLLQIHHRIFVAIGVYVIATAPSLQVAGRVTPAICIISFQAAHMSKAYSAFKNRRLAGQQAAKYPLSRLLCSA
jgi:hypothetical protein